MGAPRRRQSSLFSYDTHCVYDICARSNANLQIRTSSRAVFHAHFRQLYYLCISFGRPPCVWFERTAWRTSFAHSR